MCKLVENGDKCELGAQRVEYLGRAISLVSLEVDRENVAAVVT